MVFIIALSLNIHKNGCRVSVFEYLLVAAAWTHVHWYELYASGGFSHFNDMSLKLFTKNKKSITLNMLLQWLSFAEMAMWKRIFLGRLKTLGAPGRTIEHFIMNYTNLLNQTLLPVGMYLFAYIYQSAWKQNEKHSCIAFQRRIWMELFFCCIREKKHPREDCSHFL